MPQQLRWSLEKECHFKINSIVRNSICQKDFTKLVNKKEVIFILIKYVTDLEGGADPSNFGNHLKTIPLVDQSLVKLARRNPCGLQ